MKRLTTVSVAGLTALLLAFGPNASAGSQTVYFGKTAPGERLLFIVAQGSHGSVFEPIFIQALVTCPATGDQIRFEFDFSGFRIPLQSGHFTFSFNDIQDDFLWAGKVSDTKAAGPFHFNFPAFDMEGGLQTCGSGSLTWKAKGVSSQASRSTAQGPAPSVVVKVTKDRNGKVSFLTQR